MGLSCGQNAAMIFKRNVLEGMVAFLSDETHLVLKSAEVWRILKRRHKRPTKYGSSDSQTLASQRPAQSPPLCREQHSHHCADWPVGVMAWHWAIPASQSATKIALQSQPQEGSHPPSGCPLKPGEIIKISSLEPFGCEKKLKSAKTSLVSGKLQKRCPQ